MQKAYTGSSSTVRRNPNTGWAFGFYTSFSFRMGRIYSLANRFNNSYSSEPQASKSWAMNNMYSRKR